MGSTDIDICSQALDGLGIPPISSFEDNRVAATCGRLYTELTNRLLAGYNWNFARALAAMEREASAPAGLWMFSYLLPVDMVRPGVYAIYRTSDINQAPYKLFEVAGKKILSDSPSLFIAYTRRPAEGDWPPHFYQLAIYAMKAELAMPLTEDPAKAQDAREIAYGLPSEAGIGGYMRTARLRDSQADPPARVMDYTLIEARLGDGLPDLR